MVGPNISSTCQLRRHLVDFGTDRDRDDGDVAGVELVGLPAIVALMRDERVPRSQETNVAGQRTARNWTRSELLRDPILYILLTGTLAPAFIRTVIFFHQGYLIEFRDTIRW